MDKDLVDIISKEFSFFSQEELEQAVGQAREEIQADLGKYFWINFTWKAITEELLKGDVL